MFQFIHAAIVSFAARIRFCFIVPGKRGSPDFNRTVNHLGFLHAGRLETATPQLFWRTRIQRSAEPLIVYCHFDCASICRSPETCNCSSIHYVNSSPVLKHAFVKRLAGSVRIIRDLEHMINSPVVVLFRMGDDNGCHFIVLIPFKILSSRGLHHPQHGAA